MDCTQLSDAAPELALGVLDGRERAEALEHLDGCSACRQLVNSLSGVTDELLRTFAPSLQPPAGFETRVLNALTPPARVRPLHVRRAMTASLAMAACIALLFGLVLGIGPLSRPAVASAEMKTASGEVVGWIYVDRDHPAVYMALPGWVEQIQRYGHQGDTYSLRLTARSGANSVLPVSLDDNAGWKAVLDLDPGSIASAALIDGSGHIWCQADLGST